MEEREWKPSVFVNWLTIAPIYAPIVSAIWFAFPLAFVEFPHPSVLGILGLAIMVITTKTGLVGVYCSPFAIVATLLMIDWSKIQAVVFIVAMSCYWAFCYYRFWSCVSKLESGKYESVCVCEIDGKVMEEYFSKEEFFSKRR